MSRILLAIVVALTSFVAAASLSEAKPTHQAQKTVSDVDFDGDGSGDVDHDSR
jgi:hypothetical protein